MRPILVTEDKDEYSEAWSRLSEHGIPVFEPSKHSDMSGFRIGVRGRTLCIWLDSQYEDAINLLRDPSHVVTNPVDPEEFARIQGEVDESMDEGSDRLTEKIMNWLVSTVALSIASGLAYVALR